MNPTACAVCNRAVYEDDVDEQGRCCFCERDAALDDGGREALPAGSTIPPEGSVQPAPTSFADKGGT